MDSKDLDIAKLTIQNAMLTACVTTLLRKTYPELTDQERAEKASELFDEVKTRMNRNRLNRIYHNQ